MPIRRAATIAAATGVLAVAGCQGFQLPDAIMNERARPTVSAETFTTGALVCLGRLADAQPGGRDLIVTPNLVDGTESRGGTVPGQVAGLITNSMAMTALQKIGARRISGALNWTAANAEASRQIAAGRPRPRMLGLEGGTQVREAVREQGGEGRAAPNPFTGSAGRDVQDTAYYLTMFTHNENGLTDPGLAYSLNAWSSRTRDRVSLGISTSTYSTTFGFGQGATSITPAGAAQVMIETAVLVIVAQALNIDPARCIGQAHDDGDAVARWRGLSAPAQRAEIVRLLMRSGDLGSAMPSDRMLAEAVARAQRRLGLPINGFFDQALYAALLRQGAAAPASDRAAAAWPPPSAPPTAAGPPRCDYARGPLAQGPNTLVARLPAGAMSCFVGVRGPAGSPAPVLRAIAGPSFGRLVRTEEAGESRMIYAPAAGIQEDRFVLDVAYGQNTIYVRIVP